MTAMARQKCWWCRNWSCLRSGGTWLVHLMSVALALPLNRPAGFGIAGRQCNSLQYNGLLLFWPPALVLVHYSTLHGWRKHWQCPFPHCAQIFIFIMNQNEKLILDHVWSCCTICTEYSATFSLFWWGIKDCTTCTTKWSSSVENAVAGPKPGPAHFENTK